MKGIIAEIFWPSKSSLLKINKTVNKYGTTRANMSTVMDEGVQMCCKSVTSNLFTVVCLLVEPITSIEKPKGYLEAYLSIS